MGFNKPQGKVGGGTGSSRLAALRGQEQKGRGQGLKWSEVDATALYAVMGAVIEKGAAVMVGRTSDGGALVITILDDGDRQKFYAANPDELRDILARIGGAYAQS